MSEMTDEELIAWARERSAFYQRLEVYSTSNKFTLIVNRLEALTKGEVTEELLSLACGAYEARSPHPIYANRECMRAALKAALSVQKGEDEASRLLSEKNARIAELERVLDRSAEVLERTAGLLYLLGGISYTYGVSPKNGHQEVMDAVKSARAALNGEGEE